MLSPLVVALPLVAGCRCNFDPLAANNTKDAPEPDTTLEPDGPVVAPAPRLPCGAPPKFMIDNPAGAGSGSGSGGGSDDAGPGLTLVSFAAAAGTDTYFGFAADSAGDVHASSFAFDTEKALAMRMTDVKVYTGAGLISAAATRDGVLASIVYGGPDGTALLPLGLDLAPPGTVKQYPRWFGGEGTLALSADGETLAFLGETSDTAGDPSGVSAQLVNLDGTMRGSQHGVINRAESAREPTLIQSGQGFLVTWSSGPEVRAAIYDKQLAQLVVGTTTINPTPMFDGQGPRVAYAAKADRYLFAYWFKDGVSDQVRLSLRDANLIEIMAITVPTPGKMPRVVAGDDDFLVAWRDPDASSLISAARVTFNGELSPLTITGDGKTSLGWDLVTRAGQPALIWLEDSGAKLTGWFDPLCDPPAVRTPASRAGR